jgi:curved DNA-binding protein CbpA
MKQHYTTLGLQEGASQEEIEVAYKRLSKELDPANNDNQEFFKEEYKKLQQAYKALSASSILATKQGAKQIVKKPNSSSKKKNDSVKPIKDKLNTPKKKNVRRDILLLFIATGIWGLLLQNIGFFDNIKQEYQRDYITKNMTILQLRAQDLTELTRVDQIRILWHYGMTITQLNILKNAKEEDLISHIIGMYQRAYNVLGLQENASQKEIQDAYDRLSKELKPPNGLKYYYDILLRLTMPIEELQNFIRGEYDGFPTLDF